MVTFEQIKELIDIVCQKGLQGLEVERSDFRLRIEGQSRGGTVAVADSVVETHVDVPLDAGTVTGSEAESAPAESEASGEHTVSSPIVGTFYSAPSPDADPYVQIGDEVKAGQVLCIVEAMKLMNEIESDVDGIVVEILGRNAQPVEFGEPLFTVKPA